MKSLTSISASLPWARVPEINLNTPSWFLASNVKTTESLSSKDSEVELSTVIRDGQNDEQSQLKLSASHSTTRDINWPSTIIDRSKLVEEKNEIGSEYRFEIYQDIYSELVDMTRQALRVNDQFEDDSQHPTILLRTPIRGSMSYMQSIVERLAGDVGAELISFTSEDITDISLDFAFQDHMGHIKDLPLRELSQHYFGFAPSLKGTADVARVEKATSAIIDSAKAKRRTMGTVNRMSHNHIPAPATLIHINDAEQFLGLPGGTKILKSFRTQIQERRKRNENIILVVTVHSYESLRGCYNFNRRTNQMTIYRKVLVDQSSTIDIIPASKKLTLKRHQSCCIIEANIRHLKRALRKRLPNLHEHDSLTPRPYWETPDMAPMHMVLSKSLIPEPVLERAAGQIAWRARDGSPPKLDDIYQVTKRLLSNQELTKEWGKIQENTVKMNFVETKMEYREAEMGNEEIGMETDETEETEMEKELRNCLVNPENIRVRFEDVVVDDEVKRIMKQLLSLSNFRAKGISESLFERMRITGALLYGPPGTGKTHLTRALAKEMGMQMMAITAATIQSKWVGETEKYIRAAFSLCSKLAPCILFIDEADAIFSKRSSNDAQYERSSINQFLQEMDGLATDKSSPFVLVATNRPMDLDEAFLRRLPQRIQFKLPSEDQRRQILRNILKNTELHFDIDIETLTKMTAGFSGSDLQSFCVQAAIIFTAEEKEKDNQLNTGAAEGSQRPGLERRHFLEALKRTHRTVSEQSEIDNDEFTYSFSPKYALDSEEPISYPSIYENSEPASSDKEYTCDCNGCFEKFANIHEAEYHGHKTQHVNFTIQ
ncbi:P-loop containing nucleoside triphosphate hydrolase protein [Daldinia vernicosa]|uniref:P-loop containing nucleoside triphosphate hydrolase protein n=1 Tax=Daldinia vernicosa TaxID=114800 RepID=UPI002008389A|nr:P-loop containing nucleoside triphosphate hydrolase protein [Daldinia vernicosa]KAI0845011.1 P-loop containing nucleoside triphosphate hydrolase protein [Daldinia vernicosa]